jgi:hypothetical protein
MALHYRSEQTWRGVPIVHIEFGTRAGGRYRPARARGVVAIGDIATGVVAVGPVAIGVVAVGPVAAGLVTVGAVAAGLVAVGVDATLIGGTRLAPLPCPSPKGRGHRPP